MAHVVQVWKPDAYFLPKAPTQAVPLSSIYRWENGYNWASENLGKLPRMTAHEDQRQGSD